MISAISLLRLFPATVFSLKIEFQEKIQCLIPSRRTENTAWGLNFETKA